MANVEIAMGRPYLFKCRFCGGATLNYQYNTCQTCYDKKINSVVKCACGCGQEMKEYVVRHNGMLRQRRFLPEHNCSKSTCSIKFKCPVCQRGLTDTRTFHRHIDENRCVYKDKMDEWKKNWKHECDCGCGEITLPGRKSVKSHVPSERAWNYGLKKEDDPRLMEYSHRRLVEMQNEPGKSGQWMQNTSIEKKMRDILHKLVNGRYKIYFQYNFYYKFTADFAIPALKLIVECDGDYWHNYPIGTDEDEEENEFVIHKGWSILRFWERDINKNPKFVVEMLKNAILKQKGIAVS